MTLIRKKLSKSAILLLGLIAVGAIVAIVLHFVGMIDLSFIGGWLVAIAEYGASSPLTAGIIGGATFFAGLATCYLLKDYLVGMEVKGNISTPGGYNPVPTQPSESNVVVS